MITRRGLLLAPAVALARREEPEAAAIRKAVARGAEFLRQRQSRGGGWHSATYGLLRSGQSLTPLVLLALVEARAAPRETIERALGFLRRNTNAGALGMSDPFVPDYPCYASALGVMAMAKTALPGWRDHAAPMVEWLRGQQFSESGGWTREHPAYGGWGMGGERRTPPHPGHVDLSMTRHVLQALAAGGVSTGDEVFTRAQVFLDRCRGADGGFHFSSVVLDANKAGCDARGFRSYGSATADGILSLIACRSPVSDRRVESAARWLTQRHRTDVVPGFEESTDRRWARGLRFYYLSACAELGYRPEKLVAEQLPDGSWKNDDTLGKEDDPLIATSFALRALVSASRLLSVSASRF